MIDIKLLPIDDDTLINVYQISKVERADEIEVENEPAVLNGSIITMANGEEIILTEEQTDSLFASAIEQIDVMRQLQQKLTQ